jgi:toxin ParE1/3/4
MSEVRYSLRAEYDLNEIAEYTKRTWSEAQADRYLGEIQSCCERLADSPALGRKCDAVRLGVRRMEQGSHVIFFTVEKKGIVVARILHKSMVPSLQDFD